jgi:fucose 4-O-acetylase-like acetyltransferase
MADTSHKRHLFIDLYRSAVILLMLEGHIFRELLSSSIQQTSLFQFHEFFHGLSAPAFLFGSGLTFVISTRKRWEDFHHWGTPLSRRVKRLGFVLLLGLFLHLPFFSFRKIVMEGTTENLLQLFQCDVLCCIGIGLLTLHALLFLFKHERRFYALVLVAILLACFLTPLMWDFDAHQYLPLPIAQLVNSTHGSQFPLFPFVGFLFAGVIVSWEYTIAVERNTERKFMRQIIGIGAGLIFAGLIFDFIPVQIYPTYNFWYTSPSYFFIRLGSLMLMIGGFWYLAQKIAHANKLFTVFGKESLFVYVLHLLVLTGSVINPDTNLRELYGRQLTFIQASGVFIVFTTLCLFVALLWDYLKEKKVYAYRIIQFGTSAVFLYYFFRRDY